MPPTDAAVATDHHPRLAVERANVRLLHRMAHDSRATVAHDLHVKIDSTDPFTLTDLFHRLEFVIRMSAATDDRDVRWPTYVREPARNVCRIVVTSTRNQHSDRRAPGVVRVTIGSHVLTARACFVN